ncbi:MAG: hypothetical protein AAGJ46_06420 [Planctomycetota bacterium]
MIEVVLAIGLSTVLLALLTSAINLYLTRVDASRSAVADAQVARSLLRLVAEDLRNAATAFEQDTSLVEQLAASQATFDVDELDQAGQSETEVEPPVRRMLGLYGDAISLQLDVNRSRPIDPVIAFGGNEEQAAGQSLLGVTTVRYVVTEEGLVRQEIPRDTHVYEVGGGSASPSLDASSRVIAPEVTEMRLAYSDSEQTFESWDSEAEEGALPAAVEVQLAIRSSQTASDDPSVDPSANAVITVHRLVVALPEANLPAEESAAEDSSGSGTAGGV